MKQSEIKHSLLTNNSNKSTNGPEKYKKNLLAQVVTIFLICLVIILERVFYQIVIDTQQIGLNKFQQFLGLIYQTQPESGKYEPLGIKNGPFVFYGALSQFSVQFLLLTHFLVTIYVSLNSMIGTKVTYISLGCVYIVSILQLLYTGCRPFWAQRGILTSQCLSPYNHPSLGLILLIFTPFYTLYCWQQTHKNKLKNLKKKYFAIIISYIVIVLGSQFLNFIIGTMYIINIIMSIVICTMLLMIALTLNRFIDRTIKQSTIFKTEAKKYVFYWLLLICMLATFVLFVYSGEQLFLDIDWVENYMHCTRYLNYPNKTYRYDEVIGPWFNLMQTSSLFGWIGAVFGTNLAFRKIRSVNWAGGSLKNRILRGLIANLLIIPSWIFIMFLQYNGDWIKAIGLNNFIVNSVHFFILYLWMFGYMPILLFNKILKINNKQDEDFYVIMEQSDQTQIK